MNVNALNELVENTKIEMDNRLHEIDACDFANLIDIYGDGNTTYKNYSHAESDDLISVDDYTGETIID